MSYYFYNLQFLTAVEQQHVIFPPCRTPESLAPSGIVRVYGPLRQTLCPQTYNVAS